MPGPQRPSSRRLYGQSSPSPGHANQEQAHNDIPLQQNAYGDAFKKTGIGSLHEWNHGHSKCHPHQG